MSDREKVKVALDEMLKYYKVRRNWQGTGFWADELLALIQPPILHERSETGAWICCCGDHLVSESEEPVAWARVDKRDEDGGYTLHFEPGVVAGHAKEIIVYRPLIYGDLAPPEREPQHATHPSLSACFTAYLRDHVTVGVYVDYEKHGNALVDMIDPEDLPQEPRAREARADRIYLAPEPERDREAIQHVLSEYDSGRSPHVCLAHLRASLVSDLVSDQGGTQPERAHKWKELDPNEASYRQSTFTCLQCHEHPGWLAESELPTGPCEGDQGGSSWNEMLYTDLHTIWRELLDIVCDDDLTDDKLQEAAGGVIPMAATAIGKVLFRWPPPQPARDREAMDLLIEVDAVLRASTSPLYRTSPLHNRISAFLNRSLGGPEDE